MQKNKKINQLIFLLSVLIVGVFIISTIIYNHTGNIHKEKVKVDTIVVVLVPDFFDKSPKEGLMEALEFYNVHHKEIVYTQAILETGNFKSKGCTEDNNLFGIMFNGKHAEFNHWSESVLAYRDKVQYKYLKSDEDYYNFLRRIGYAEDPLYIEKLKNIK